MDFDHKEEVDESEIEALGMKKKDNDSVDAIADIDDPIEVDDILSEDDEEIKEDTGIFGDDPELEAYMLGEETY